MADDEDEAATAGPEEEEEEEVSDAERLRIVQHFLLNAPPGELVEVLNDASALIPDGLIEAPMLAGICRAYNSTNQRVLTEGVDDKPVILCKAGEVDPTHYIEPTSGSVYQVDHVKMAATKSEAAPPAATAVEAERVAVEACIDEYIETHYGAEAKCGAAYSAGDSSIAVVISGERVNLRNFWTGNWRSTWKVEVQAGTATLEGTMSVRAHYFEDGNVQLQTSKEVGPKTLAYRDAVNFGSLVVEAIAEYESALQMGLDDMYNNMSSETFKAMRRVMPITRTKMKWNINEIALNRNLRK